MKNKILLLVVTMAVMVAMLPGKGVKAQETNQEEVLVSELSKQEVEEMLEEGSGGIELYSTPSCRLLLKKDKGMVKIIYTVTALDTSANIKLSPLALKQKSGLSWKTVFSRSPYKNNTKLFSGGYCYRNPSFNVTYKAEANFYITKGGKTTRYYRSSNTLTY